MDYCSNVVGAPFKSPEVAIVLLSDFGEIWIFGYMVDFLPDELAGIKMAYLKKEGKKIALRSLFGGQTIKEGIEVLRAIELLVG
jgi:hypothetical protein